MPPTNGVHEHRLVGLYYTMYLLYDRQIWYQSYDLLVPGICLYIITGTIIINILIYHNWYRYNYNSVTIVYTYIL